MKLIKFTFSALLMFAFSSAFAQDDLMKELDSGPKEKVASSAAFKGLQVANMQSTKLPEKGEFYFLVSHRFSDFTDGLNNFFGLDGALTKFGGIYGITSWLSIGASRHTFQKTYEAALKYRILNQIDNGFPLTIVGYNTMDIRSDLKPSVYPDLRSSDRFAFSNQLIISRKFNSSISAELTSIFIHKNLYDDTADQKDNFLIGTGARFKISKRLSLNFDYAARLNKLDGTPYHNPATVGLDIETGGHVFQLVFSNSQTMNDVSYYTTASGITEGKGIFFGFNMYRAF